MASAEARLQSKVGPAPQGGQLSAPDKVPVSSYELGHLPIIPLGRVQMRRLSDQGERPGRDRNLSSRKPHAKASDARAAKGDISYSRLFSSLCVLRHRSNANVSFRSMTGFEVSRHRELSPRRSRGN